MMRQLLMVVALGLALVLPAGVKALAGENEHQIMHLMKAQFDTPENPLSVDPVVVAGDFAVAGWVQGEKGGRALLRKQEGTWSVHLCSGDGLKDAAVLHQSGIDEATAKALAEAVAKAEAGLDIAILKKLASFEGTVMINGGDHGGHSAHGTHGAHGTDPGTNNEKSE